jgi:hypothetical protein
MSDCAPVFRNCCWRRDLAVETLERAAHVIFVTCKNWFFPEGPRADEPEKPETTAAGPEEKDKPRS